MILPQTPKSILNNPIVLLNFNPIDMSRLFILRLKVYFFLRFDIEVKILIRFTLIDSLRIPKSNITIRTCTYYFFLVISNVFYLAIMARILGTDSDYWFYDVSLPKKQFTVFRRTQYITIFVLGIRSHIWKLELTELSYITLEFETCKCLGYLPESYVTCSTSR